jgi:hypothetical protein
MNQIYDTYTQDPDETFKMYVERLMNAQPKFGGTFVNPPQGQGQQEQSQGQDSTSKATGGLLTGLFPEYADKMGGGADAIPRSTLEDNFGGSGGDNGEGAPTGPGQGINNDTIALGLGMMGMNPSATSSLVGAAKAAGIPTFGIPGFVAGRAVPWIGGAVVDNQIDGITNAFDSLVGFNSLPGVVSVSDMHGNVSGFSSPTSIGLSDHGMFGAVSTGSGLADTSNVGNTGMGVTADGTSVSNDATIGAQDAANFGSDASSGGGTGGDSKIVCTAMNEAYGFGGFRQAIWLRYSAEHMTKEHEKGYHALFLPLVNAAYAEHQWYSRPLRKVLENIARHRTADIRAEMRGNKRDALGRVYRAVLEPLCYVVGKWTK